MTTYRITRTTLRGQFANDACFVVWMQEQPSERARVIDWYEDPAVGSQGESPNDRRIYLWSQDADVTPPICPNGQPDLIADNGKNGWFSEGDARVVLNRLLGVAGAIEKQVASANAKAISPAHLIESAANDAAKAGAAIADVATSSTTRWLVGGVVGAAALYALARVLGR